MANNSVTGFRFLRMRNGSDRPVVELRDVASAYSTAIFKGDPVNYDTASNPGTVVIAAAGANVYGIADGAEQYVEGGVVRRGNYLPASTTWTLQEQRSVVRVILARDSVFEIQTNNTTAVAPTTLANWNAKVNMNADHVAGAGSTANGRSAYFLDIAGAAGTSAQWRIVGFDRNQDLASQYVKVQVEVNESLEPQYATTSY